MMQKVWVISVSMGYGHQRTAYPLKDLAPEGEVINANAYQGIPQRDRKIWEGMRMFYEFISRLKRLPLIGETAFAAYDKFQKILSFYPKRDLSEPNLQLKQIFSLIKKGWGGHLIERFKQKSLPLISTFFIPAFMAEYLNYPGKIYCIICDADISRTWVSFNPSQSKIKYFAPTRRVTERLKLYGVKPENIYLTGYPLPLELLGSENLEILKNDLLNRILNLDPKGRYRHYYEPLIKKYLGDLPQKSNHPLTIMFAVGGAGAQKEIGTQIIKSLKNKIKNGEVKIILAAGIKEKVKKYFKKNIGNLNGVEIIFGRDINDYFQKFNQALRKTDVLWTKPSELSFYAALGLPIIIAPPIGSQEDFNKRWLLKSGFGNFQENPNLAHQWLFDWLDGGYLAEAAMQGFIEGEKLGAFNIQKIISK